MNLRCASEPVVVGDGEGGVAEFGGTGDKIERVGGPVEEAVVRVCVKLCVSCHNNIVIEHMFDVLRATGMRQNQRDG